MQKQDRASGNWCGNAGSFVVYDNSQSYELAIRKACTGSGFPQNNIISHGGFVASAGYTYDITPSRNNDPSNGVTTYDLTLVSKHILGITPLDTPYKIIPAPFLSDESES